MAYADVILAEASLQSYWRLGEAVGSGTVADSKGAITGTVTVDVVLGKPGLLAGDGNTCAEVVTASAPGAFIFGSVYPFTGTASFSCEAWIRPTAAALAANAMVFYNNDATDGWYLRVLAAGGIRLARVGATVANLCSSANGIIVADTVYHVVGTYDGATLLVYVNGVQVATLASTMSIGDTTAELGLCEPVAGGNVLFGFTDEAAIYNDDLAAASVLAHYQAGIYRGLRFDYSQFPKAMLRPPVPVRY